MVRLRLKEICRTHGMLVLYLMTILFLFVNEGEKDRMRGGEGINRMKNRIFEYKGELR